MTVQDGTLLIEDKNAQKSNTLLLSENMTTESVSTLINFESQDFGKYQLPNESITKIVTNRTGFLSCLNLHRAGFRPHAGDRCGAAAVIHQAYFRPRFPHD